MNLKIEIPILQAAELADFLTEFANEEYLEANEYKKKHWSYMHKKSVRQLCTLINISNNIKNELEKMKEQTT